MSLVTISQAVWEYSPRELTGPITVESISTADSAGVATSACTISKPTGLEIGDLLLAHVYFRINTVPVTPPTGWSTAATVPLASDRTIAIFYKRATSADVAASSFTFTLSSGSAANIGGIFRISGATAAVVASAAQNIETTRVISGITPPAGSLLFMFLGQPSFGGNFSSYAITTDNPTWTEAYDLTAGSMRSAAAYAVRPQGTATGDATFGGNITDWGGALVAVYPADQASVVTPTTRAEELAELTWSYSTRSLTSGGSNQAVAAETAASAWAAQTPSALAGSVATPASAAVSGWQAIDPSVSAGGGAQTINAPVAEGTWQAHTPTVLSSVTAGAQTAASAWEAQTPSVASSGVSISAPAPVGTWSAQTPVVGPGEATAPAEAAAANWQALSPSVQVGAISIPAGPAESSWLAVTPAVDTSVAVVVPAAASGWETQAAAVRLVGSTTAVAAESNWDVVTPTVVTGAAAVGVSAVAVTWEAITPAVGAGAVTSQAQAAQGSFSAQAATVAASLTREVVGSASSWMAIAATVLVGSVTLLAASAQGTWQPQAPNVQGGAITIQAPAASSGWVAGEAEAIEGFTVAMGLASRAGSARRFGASVSASRAGGSVNGPEKPGESSARGVNKPGGRVIT